MKLPLQTLCSSPGILATLLAGISLLTQGYAQNQDPEISALPPVPGAEIGEKIAKAAESHPAVESLTAYLKASISNHYLEAVQYIEPTSLEAYKFRTLNAVRTQLDAVTLEGSKRARMRDILNELGFDSMEQMTDIGAKEFYVKVNNRQVETNPSAEPTPMDSVSIKILGLATEDEARTVHFVTRTRHREEVMLVSNLRLTSMIKAGRDWYVSLQAQRPRLEPLPNDVIKREKSELENDPELKRLRKLLDTRKQTNGEQENGDQ